MADIRTKTDDPTANCEHWGHAPGEWKWSCCACSGLPNGCDNCTNLGPEFDYLDADCTCGNVAGHDGECR